MKFDAYLSYLMNSVRDIKLEEIELVISNIFDSYLNSKMVFVIGNGGSAANASHFAQDLAKGTMVSPDSIKRIKALSLTDNLAYISALGNDEGFENIFEQQLKTFASEGDILIAISGSGNSPNIIKAVEWGNNNGLLTIGITGFDGGLLHKINKLSLHVPLDDMCTVESIHSIVLHYIVIELKKKIGDEQRMYSKYEYIKKEK
jgi:D-sedoheptulose 7-phosphate isomerase